MPARTGKQYLEQLATDREIWLGGEKISDVRHHPAFAGAAASVAAMFDLQHESNVCLTADPYTGEAVNASHIIPRGAEDLRKRHVVFERFAEFSMGQMGRSADYMNATYAGFAGCSSEWAAGGNDRGAENIIAYQQQIARRDLLLTHAIAPPTVDKQTDGLPGNQFDVRKVADSTEGIVVRGVKMLATMAPFSDEIAVYSPGPTLDESKAHFALAFAIPTNTPGLKFICRDDFSKPAHEFDSPFSGRFDEQDAVVIFDDVLVPHDRVHIDGNIAAHNAVVGGTRRANIMQQAMIRAQTKLEFAWGLATRMVEMINGADPATQKLLGEMWTYCELARSAVEASEKGAHEYGDGVWFCRAAPLYALAAAMPEWMPRVYELIRLLGSHNLFSAPSSHEFRSELRPLLDRFLPGAKGESAERRARIFRMAWDFAGSALGARNEQYERFYLTSAVRNYQNAQRQADRARANRLLENVLGA